MKKTPYSKKTAKERSFELDRCSYEINKTLIRAGFRLGQIGWKYKEGDVLQLSCWRKQ
jgi:hypothetical protein